jgi:hypothetical protein
MDRGAGPFALHSFYYHNWIPNMPIIALTTNVVVSSSPIQHGPLIECSGGTDYRLCALHQEII